MICEQKALAQLRFPSQSACAASSPYPFCRFATFPPDRGNRPRGRAKFRDLHSLLPPTLGEVAAARLTERAFKPALDKPAPHGYTKNRKGAVV